MKIINAGFQILTNINGMEMLKNIEYIARTCYKSEYMMTDLSAVKMVESSSTENTRQCLNIRAYP